MFNPTPTPQQKTKLAVIIILAFVAVLYTVAAAIAAFVTTTCGVMCQTMVLRAVHSLLPLLTR